MIKLIFGANAPVLQQIILDELKIEQECMKGLRTRITRSPYELSEEERAKEEELARKEELVQKVLTDKLLKKEREHKLAQAKNILATYAPIGLIVVFPHASSRANEVVERALHEAGLSVGKREKPIFTEAMLNDIEYFATFKIPEQSRPFLLNGEKCMAYSVNLLEGTPGPTDDAVLSFVYGGGKCPPGEPGTPARILLKSRTPIPRPEIIEGEREEEVDVGLVPEPVPEEELEDIMGVWAPSNEFVKAIALRHVLPSVMQQFLLPEPEPAPPHVAVAFDVFKRVQVLQVIKEYGEEVMAYGFFTDQDCNTAKLIAKTAWKFEKIADTVNFGAKLIVKVSKKRSDPLLAFVQLGPTYISENVDVGEDECAVFFPEDYNAIDEEEAPKVKGPKHKKSKVRISQQQTEPTEEIVFEEGVIGELPEGHSESEGEVEGEEEIHEQGDDEGEGVLAGAEETTELLPVQEVEEEGGKDKATSPMHAPPAEEE